MTEFNDDKPKTQKEKSFKEQILAELEEANCLRKQHDLEPRQKEKEAEEFIVYWLPRLEANKYNYIRFATLDEINANMPLEINPNPDSIIRIMMTFKGLDNPIDVKEQELVTPERNGFVAVEWGGTEIK